MHQFVHPRIAYVRKRPRPTGVFETSSIPIEASVAAKHGVAINSGRAYARQAVPMRRVSHGLRKGWRTFEVEVEFCKFRLVDEHHVILPVGNLEETPQKVVCIEVMSASIDDAYKLLWPNYKSILRHFLYIHTTGWFEALSFKC